VRVQSTCTGLDIQLTPPRLSRTTLLGPSASFDREIRGTYHRRVRRLVMASWVLLAACSREPTESSRTPAPSTEALRAARAKPPTPVPPRQIPIVDVTPSKSSSAPDASKDTPDLPKLPDVQAPEWKPRTRVEQLTFEMSEEQGPPTKQQVVDYLGLVVPGMPGVTPSRLPKGDTGHCGTYANGLYQRYGNQLSPAQRRAADKYFGKGVLVGCIIDGETLTAAECRARRAQKK